MSAASKRSSLWLGAALVFLSMATLGWKLGSGRDSSATAPRGDRDRSSKSARSARDRASERATLARQRVGEIARGGSSEHRLRATIELANSLSPDEFAEWIDGGWFDFRSGFELTLFRRILEERWRLEDPEGYVAWCLEDGQDSVGWAVSNPKSAALPVLTEWALNAPERLASFFQKHPNDALEAQLITRLAADHPEAALARLHEMLARGSQGYPLQSALAALAKSSPAAVEARLPDLPAPLRLQAESTLVAQRLKSSFPEEMRALWDRPDGWRLFSNSISQVEGVSEKLLAELPNLPASWLNGIASGNAYSLFYNSDSEPWLHADLESAGFTPEQADRIRSTALSALASRKPERALELLPGAVLEERARNNVIMNLFWHGRSDPEKAETWLAMLDTDAERETARSVLGTGNQSGSTIQREFKTPEEWIEGALADGPDPMREHFLGSSLQRWSPEQIAGLTERFQELPADQQDRIAQVVVESSQSFNRTSPALAGEAVRHLLNAEPTGDANDRQARQLAQAASTNAARWVLQDAEAASNWVDSLPDSDVKLWAQKNMAANWANYDPESTEQWVQSLPADTRAEVREFMAGPSAP